MAAPPDQRRLEPSDVLKRGWGAKWPNDGWSDGGADVTGKLIARVETPRGPLCLRCYPPRADRDWLASLHRVVDDVASRGFQQFPRFIPGAAGSTLIALDERLYDLSTWAEGAPRPLGGYSESDLESIGATLGSLHSAGVDVDPPIPFFSVGREARWEPEHWLDASACERLRQDVKSYAQDPRLRADSVGRVVADAFAGLVIRDVVGSCGPRTITHLDLTRVHFYFSPTNVTTLLDVDLLDRRGAGVDVAAMVSACAQWDIARAGALVRGYRRHFDIELDHFAVAIQLWLIRTVGVIVQRLEAWRNGQQWGAGPALGSLLAEWCAEITVLRDNDAHGLAARLLANNE